MGRRSGLFRKSGRAGITRNARRDQAVPSAGFAHAMSGTFFKGDRKLYYPRKFRPFSKPRLWLIERYPMAVPIVRGSFGHSRVVIEGACAFHSSISCDSSASCERTRFLFSPCVWNNPSVVRFWRVGLGQGFGFSLNALPCGIHCKVLSNLTTAHYRYAYSSRGAPRLRVRHTDGIGIQRLVKQFFALFSKHQIGDTGDNVLSLLFPNTFAPIASDTISSNKNPYERASNRCVRVARARIATGVPNPKNAITRGLLLSIISRL